MVTLVQTEINVFFYILIFSCYRRTLSLEQALAYLEELEAEENLQVDDIFIEPPDPRVETDEDSGEEDEGGLVDNLTGHQLRAAVEIKLSNNDRITDDSFIQDLQHTATAFSGLSNSSSPVSSICTTPVSNLVSSTAAPPARAKRLMNRPLSLQPQATESVGPSNSSPVALDPCTTPISSLVSLPATPPARANRLLHPVHSLQYTAASPRSVNSSLPSCNTAIVSRPASSPLHPSVTTDNFITQNETWVKNRNNKRKRILKWIDGDFAEKKSNFPAEDYSAYASMTVTEIFELFLNDDIVNYLVDETRKYALFLNLTDPKITGDEIRCFVSILMLSGYNQVPSRKNYWENAPDIKNEFISQSMRRDRFLLIMRFVHCADNTKVNKADKVWKLRPLMDKFKARFLENFVPSENMNYDESMVKYYGKHGCKQFIRGKPIRFGYKIWALNSSFGYLVNFDVYQGKNPRSKESYDLIFGKCAAPLIRFMEELPPEKRELPYNLFFDNLFTCPNLLSFLRFRGYSGTGTVRENRIGKICPLTKKKQFCKTKKRGEFEKKIEKSDGILYVTWMDNSAVTVCSTAFGINPVKMVSRFSKAQRKKIVVPRPHLIGTYNNCMGGTDLMDENINQYRIAIRGKKWWWPIFTWMIDACVNNAWLLYRKSRDDSIPQIAFRREIVKIWLTRYGTPAKVGGRPSISISSLSGNRISDDIRYDGRNHYVIPTPEKRRRRCAGEGCCSSIRTMCEKCDVGLCIECFKIFHTQTYQQ